MVSSYLVKKTGIMKKEGPVIIIEDDLDDKEMLEEVFKKLGYPNELLFFGDGESALDFLNESSVIPFIILSDINMPKLDGFALRDKIKWTQTYNLSAFLIYSFPLPQAKKL
jgi:CheY-like chemotaxis protein